FGPRCGYLPVIALCPAPAKYCASVSGTTESGVLAASTRMASTVRIANILFFMTESRISAKRPTASNSLTSHFGMAGGYFVTRHEM
ncbi:hypothetical protein, partial [Pseudomonas tremae]|uniref:hypothetical protein n=1 Tax=Pseudomonas tremae TaxID=200454 RepID=UPI001C3F37B8